MTKLSIDDNAIELIKKELLKENASAIRIFTGGGGCCKRFEMAPVKKALAGDVTYERGGIKVYIEKELAESPSGIYIRLDEQRGLIIEFQDQLSLNKINS